MLRLTTLHAQPLAAQHGVKRARTSHFGRRSCGCRCRPLSTLRPRWKSSIAAVASWQDGGGRQRRDKERRPFRLGPGAAVPILLALAAASVFGPLILAVSAAVIATSVAVAIGAAAFTVFLPLTVGVGVLGLLFGTIFNATVAAGLLIVPLLAGTAVYSAVNGRRAASDSDSPFVRGLARFGRQESFANLEETLTTVDTNLQETLTKVDETVAKVEETFGLPSRPLRRKAKQTVSQGGNTAQETKEAREEREARERAAAELTSFDELLRARERDRQRG